jgi:hypothetical protein
MGNIEFQFDDLLRELQTIMKIAAPFIRIDSEFVLPRLVDDLKSIRSAEPDRVLTWQIPEANPLRTQTSTGSYERLPRRGREHIFAELTSVWEIARVRTRRKEVERFSLRGKTSTKIRLRRDNKAGIFQEVAVWRVELGDSASPGCHFHIQVLGDRKKRPFPSSISIPRFPSIFATPMLVLDFVLGELFQDEWGKRVSADSGETKLWNSIQSQRFLQLFDWHRKSIMSRSGSPWIAIKNEKPEANLFLAKSGK